MIDDRLLSEVWSIAQKAGRVILAHYTAPPDDRLPAVESKADDSPVTPADRAADALIVSALERLTPTVPVISEESHDPRTLQAAGYGQFWLVDPLDGTREYLNRNGEFTVNIALIVAEEPVLGVVHAPALGETYGGLVDRRCQFSEGDAAPVAIKARATPTDAMTLLMSRSHNNEVALEEYIQKQGLKSRIAKRIAVGSSLKFCWIARGIADLYPRLGPTMEWDTAAGHAVLRAAGGDVATLDGHTLVYGKPGLANPGFLAFGR